MNATLQTEMEQLANESTQFLEKFMRPAVERATSTLNVQTMIAHTQTGMAATNLGYYFAANDVEDIESKWHEFMTKAWPLIIQHKKASYSFQFSNGLFFVDFGCVCVLRYIAAMTNEDFEDNDNLDKQILKDIKNGILNGYKLYKQMEIE